MPESDGASEASVGSPTLSVESDGSVEHEPIDVDALAAPADALAAHAPASADASTPAALDDTPMTGSDTAAPAPVDDAAAADVLAQLLEIRRNVVAFRKQLEDLKTEHAHAEKESESKIRLEEQRLNTLTTALNKSLLV